MLGGRRFSRDRHGAFRPGLAANERELLKVLPAQARTLLEERDDSTKRLFPVAYPDDANAEREYREMMGGHLQTRHQQALDSFEATIDCATIDQEQMNQWLDALEVLRLVLGTELDVTEDGTGVDESDPRAPQFALYSYLSMLQDEIVSSLADELPDDVTTAPGDP